VCIDKLEDNRFFRYGNKALPTYCKVIHVDSGKILDEYAVASLKPAEHRLEMKPFTNGSLLIDDAYNSNPDGARMALEVLSGFVTEGKRYVVTPGFVEMGAKQFDNNRTFGGDIAKSKVDGVYVVNEVNREAITKGLSEGGYPDTQVECVASFKEAMASLQPKLKAGDVVLYENDLPDSFK
jgi:UDP-N-acetylmuramoyl-tripeptide--D-alanyl-D-alanine ligase